MSSTVGNAEPQPSASTTTTRRNRRALLAGPRRLFDRLARTSPVLLAGVTVAAAAGTAAGAVVTGKTVLELRHDDAVRTARTEAVDTAKATLPALLSYDFHTVDTEFPRVTEHLTGEFKSEFAQLSTTVIIPAAKKDSITTKAEVVETSVVDAGAEHATLLIFLNQTTTSAPMPGPRLDGSRVRVTMTSTGDGWRISEITPV